MIQYKTDIKELQKIMIDRDIKTIAELSDKSGVNRNALSGMFNERLQPTAETMRKLVSCLEIEPAKAGEIFFTPDLRDTEVLT